jgi:2-oxo-4-hydroxy-4-carboxy-5-ureidoimidazoline decarboxylase
VTVDELNALPNDGAAEALMACCGAHRWVSAMLERRPFASLESLIDAANEIWSGTNERDWREAFDHHPRIGEQRSGASPGQRASEWSAGEQSTAADTGHALRRQLADMNAAYEARFGHIYIVCASGRSAEELLEIARSRLHNEPAIELRIAAEEQRKITELRLRKLLSEAT